MDLLRKLYYAEDGFMRPDVLLKRARAKDPSITRSQVDKWILAQLPHYVNRLKSRVVPSYISQRRYMLTSVGQLGSLDVAFLTRFRRGGKIKAVLLLIDNFSNRTEIAGLNRVNAKSVEAATRKLLKRYPYKFQTLLTDRGKENVGIERLADELGIRYMHPPAHSANKAAEVMFHIYILTWSMCYISGGTCHPLAQKRNCSTT